MTELASGSRRIATEARLQPRAWQKPGATRLPTRRVVLVIAQGSCCPGFEHSLPLLGLLPRNLPPRKAGLEDRLGVNRLA